MKSLSGRVVYRLQLDDRSNGLKKNKKRRRDATSISGEKTNWKTAGFVFIPWDPQTSDEFLLSIPQSLIWTICTAIHHDIPVLIEKYSIFPFTWQKQHGWLLEVHTSGITLLKTIPSNPSVSSEIQSLSHIHYQEIAEKTPEKSSTFSISATIDAVSPIISIDPEDPFVLVELYDQSSQLNNSCVIILKGLHGLMWHSTIQPGDVLSFHQVIRKQWHIPSFLKKKSYPSYLQHRSPAFVLLFTEFSTISRAAHNQQGHGRPSEMQVCLPPTPIPLVSFTAQVVGSSFTDIKSKGHILEWVDVRLESSTLTGQDIKVARFHLRDFPLSLEAQLSLREGARIKALNVHAGKGEKTPEESVFHFGACLRSTICLLKNGSEVSGRENLSEEPTGRDATSEVRLTRHSDIIPFFIQSSTLSFRERKWRQQTNTWLETSFDDLDVNAVSRLPSTRQLQKFFRDIEGYDSAGRTFGRNPYTEFFDHAFDLDMTPAGHGSSSCGCHMSSEERGERSLPSFVDLKRMCSVGFQALASRFEAFVSKKQVSRGWTGSFDMSPRNIAEDLSLDTDFDSGAKLCIGGYVTSVSSCQQPTSIADGLVQCPVRFDQDMSVNVGDFVVGYVQNAIISCFCVQVASTMMTTTCDLQVKTLPSLRRGVLGSPSGNCTILRLGRYLLVASVQLQCESKPLLVCQYQFKLHTPRKSSERSNTTVYEALNDPRVWMERPSRVKGLLVRSRFVPAKVSPKGECKCLISTISHCELENETSENPFSLQSIKLKVSVSIKKDMREMFNQAVRDVGANALTLPDEDVNIGVSWWAIADNSSTSPMIAGGWDKTYYEMPCVQRAARLTFGTTSISVSPRGYVRWDCSLDSVHTDFVALRREPTLNVPQFSSDFVFQPTGKFFDGMLIQNCERRKVLLSGRQRCVGELLETSTHGVPSFSLADIHFLACRSIQTKDPVLVSPSVVRKLSNATILDIQFCSIRCKCSRCFEYLETTKGKFNSSFDDEPSFWRVESEQSCNDLELGVARVPNWIINSPLRCPNHCPLHAFEVEWECSALVDDGTGQAKLFAEREAAISLLGVQDWMLQEIEQSIWHVSDGTLRYYKNNPISKTLKNDVEVTIYKASKSRRAPAYKMLQPAQRAEYLLYHHCRHSLATRRRLDYFVQCKPLSDSITQLNQTSLSRTITESESTTSQSFRREHPSYTLPPIKLELVDVAVTKI